MLKIVRVSCGKRILRSVRFLVPFGMTTSLSNEETSVIVAESAPEAPEKSSAERSVYRIRHTLASRFAFLVICVAIVLSALAYGTVHYWALAFFNLGGLTILATVGRGRVDAGKFQSQPELLCNCH